MYRSRALAKNVRPTARAYGSDQESEPDATLDRLPAPSYVGKTRVGGANINQARMRTVLDATLSLVCSATGFKCG
jgi:hypothetical protein